MTLTEWLQIGSVVIGLAGVASGAVVAIYSVRSSTQAELRLLSLQTRQATWAEIIDALVDVQSFLVDLGPGAGLDAPHLSNIEDRGPDGIDAVRQTWDSIRRSLYRAALISNSAEIYGAALTLMGRLLDARTSSEDFIDAAHGLTDDDDREPLRPLYEAWREACHSAMEALGDLQLEVLSESIKDSQLLSRGLHSGRGQAAEGEETTRTEAN